MWRRTRRPSCPPPGPEPRAGRGRRRAACALAAAASLLLGLHPVSAEPADQALKRQARDAAIRAASFARDKLAPNGLAVWSYSPDLSIRRGEGGEVAATVGWVQPPGMPAYGAAFLEVYRLTEDEQWLDAAGRVAQALVSGQLLSGGWSYQMETDPAKRADWCYRSDGRGEKACKAIKDNRYKNRTVLDDNTTQSVLAFLMWYDEAREGRDAAANDALKTGLQAVLDLQYRNGAWPAFAEAPSQEHVVVPAPAASVPAEWPRTWVKPDEPPYFILNDDLLRDTVRTLLLAERRTKDPAFLEAAKRAGDFLLAAQLPAPQRGWAQTYDRTMTPVWGRKFEPPSVASRETGGAIEALLMLHGRTGEARYLDAAVEAGAWLRAAAIDKNRWARFYELKTNRPLYVTRENQIVYGDASLIDHYTVKGEFGLPQVLRRLDDAQRGRPQPLGPYWSSEPDQWSRKKVRNRAEALLQNQAPSGIWIEDDWIDSGQLVEAIFTLSRFAQTKP